MNDKTVLVIGVILGFVLIPPVARLNPPLVNGFLFLILFGSLLNQRDRWLPYLDQFSASVGGTAPKNNQPRGRLGNLIAERD